MISKIFTNGLKKFTQLPKYANVKAKQDFMGLSDQELEELKKLDEFELLSHINTRFDAAGAVAGIPADKVQFYRTCEQLVRFQLPLQRNGKIENVVAYRVIHKTHKLPAKGGLRINRYNTSKDLEAISIQNALKAAIFTIPLGGSKGLIKINPYKYSERERQLLIRRYTIELAKKNLIGPSIDLISPAIGTSEKEMNWIKDTYQSYYGQEDVHAIASAVGKSVTNFGIDGQIQAQGYGLVYTLQHLFQNKQIQDRIQRQYDLDLSVGLKGKTFMVQSFGNVGYWVSKFMVDQGAKLIGVYEYHGSVYNENGINPDELRKYMQENHKDITNYPGGEFIQGDGVIEKQCDIYIPCYTENVIHKNNQHRLNCKIIAEGCNHPITPIAGQYLRDRGIFVVPDLLSAAGGVITSYFEWIKNLSHTQHGLLTKRWEQKSKVLLLNVIKNVTGLNVNSLDTRQLDELQGASEFDMVISGLEETLSTAIDQCVGVSEELKIPLRQACYVEGIRKIHEHYENVGIPLSQ